MRSDPHFVTVTVEFEAHTGEPQYTWLDHIVRRVLSDQVELAAGCTRIAWARTDCGYSAAIPLVFKCDPDGYAAQLREAFAELSNPRVRVLMLSAR